MVPSSGRIFLTVAVLAIATPAQAYIDPGSGSLLLQVLIAAGIGAVIKFRRFFLAALKRVMGSPKK